MVIPRLVLPVVCLIALCGGCQKAPDRWEQAHKETVGQKATAENSQPGSAFNKFFPKAESPYSLVFKQEKDGFVLASLLKDGKETASLSVTDTVNNLEAKEKFAGTTGKLGDYPLAPSGSQGSAVLLADRYQVQVRSAADGGLSEAERAEWLEKFDLKGLAALR
jgi:hypothetical protein